MKFEDLLLEIGGFGRFQILILALLCLPRINLPMHFLLHNFLAATPSHHCAIPHQEEFVNLTMEEVLLVSIPRKPDGTFSSCEMFSQPQFHLLLNSSLQPENKSIIQHCQHGWVYDHSQFTSTISTQWDLVCEQRGLNQATATFFFIGVTMGAMVFGYLSDRSDPPKDRAHCFALPLSKSPAGAGEVLHVPEFCLPLPGLEWVDIQHRTFTGILSSIFWSIGNMVLALVAYLVREWHWLLVAPKERKCDVSRQKHGRELLLHQLVQDPSPEEDLSVFWRGVVSRGEFTGGEFILQLPEGFPSVPSPPAPCRFGVAFSYYGMSLNLTGFGLSIYLSQFVFGIIEIPAKMVMYVLVNRVGRRPSQAWTLILTGVCIGANIIIPKPFTSLRSVVAVMGKGFSEAAFTTVFLYTSELYPTIVRQNGMGYTSFLARLGGALAPLVFLLDEVWRSLPEVTYCGVAVCSGAMAFLLPETLNMRLPEGIEDIEKPQYRRGKKPKQHQTKPKSQAQNPRCYRKLCMEY
uniref:Solute carrier family 22 member 7 n=1 Tax=Catharus ustulatus TaxID=91951 RepID=A0A8C3TLP7_CATUS